MVGHRVSQAELYDDRDVIIQILKLKDTVNDYAGGIIEDIDVSGNDLVIDWASGESISLPLPSPTGISSISGVVSGGNLTITIYMTDGSSHAFTTPLVGFMTLDTVQTVTAKKIFGDIEVDTIPAGDDSAVNSFYVNDSTGSVSNNLLHKDGNETKDGDLTMNGHLIHPLRGTPYIPIYIQTPDNFCHILDMDHLTTRLGMDLNIFGYRVFGRLNASKEPSGNSVGLVSISATTSYNLSFFWLYNSVTNKDELWVQTTTRPFRCGMDILSITTGNAMTSTRELSLVTVVNTTTAIDPSTDTSTYPDGKYLIPISEQVIT